MTAPRTTLVLVALLAPAIALAQTGPATPAEPDFDALWTGWNGANRQSMRTESEALQRLRHEIATAEAARRRQLRGEGQELGTRVGMIVSEGDCQDGERIARAAGDFALVEAVRNYCREVIAADPASRR
jgi:hypothetical protein